MADERIVIDVIQRFKSENYTGSIHDLTNYASVLKSGIKNIGQVTEAELRQVNALRALHPEINKSANAWSNYARTLNRQGNLSTQQLANFEKVRRELHDVVSSLSEAERGFLGFGKAAVHAAEDHTTATRKIVTNTRETRKVMQEARNFTDANSGAVRRLAREFDRFTSTTGRRAISGVRAWATTLLSIVPPALPIALSAVANAIDVISGAAVQGAASLRDMAGGVGVLGAGITSILQGVGALKLGLDNLGASSQSFGKVLQSSLSESGKDFLNSLKTLPPQAARFASTVREQVFPTVHKWRQEMQGILFPSFTDAFKNLQPLMKSGGALENAFTGTGKVIAEVIRNVSKELGSKPWQDFINFQGRQNNQNFRELGTAIIPLANAFRQLTIAAAPVTKFLVDTAVHAAKTFARFIDLRAQTGALGRDALRAKNSLATWIDIFKNIGRMILDVTKIAQPFGRQMIKNFDDATKAGARFTSSAHGFQVINQFFKDIQPNIHETALLFRDLGKAMFQASSDRGLFDLLQSLRLQVLPALVSAMQSANKSGFSHAFIQSLTNVFQILANVTKPGGIAWAFINVLNSVLNVISKFSGTIGGRTLVGLIAFYRVFRLLGLIKLGRLVADWVGLSNKVAGGVQRMDAAIVAVNANTSEFSEQQISWLSKVQKEWAQLAETAKKTSLEIVEAARLARAEASQIMPMPTGFHGPGPVAGMAESAPFRTNVAGFSATGKGLTRPQAEQFLRGVGVTHIGEQQIPIGNTKALTALQVKTAAADWMKAEAAFATAAGAGVAAGVESTKAAVAEAGAKVGAQVSVAVEEATLAAGGAATMGVGIPRGNFIPLARRAGQNLQQSPLFIQQSGRLSEARGAFGAAREAGAGRFGAFRAGLGAFRAGGTGAGLGFGLPIAATIAGSMIGGRTGNVLSGAGTGAGIGFLTGGPWGALIGGIAGTALSLGLFKKGVDQTALALQRMQTAVTTARTARQRIPYARSQLQVAAIDRRQTRAALVQAVGARDDLRNQMLAAGGTPRQIAQNPLFRQLSDQVAESRQAFLIANQNWIQARNAFRETLKNAGADTRSAAQAAQTLREQVGKGLKVAGSGQFDGLRLRTLQAAEKAYGNLAEANVKNGLLGWARRMAAIQAYIREFHKIPSNKTVTFVLKQNTAAVSRQLYNLLISQGARIPDQLDVQIHGRHREGGFVIPGQRTGADNVMIMASPGEAVLTDSGQAMMDAVAPGLLDHVMRTQAPHFRRGGIVPRFATGGRVPQRIGSIFEQAQDAFTQGFNVGTPFGSERDAFIRGILSGGIFDKPKPPAKSKTAEGQIPANAPAGVKAVLRKMLSRANSISAAATDFTALPGSKPDAQGRISGWAMAPDGVGTVKTKGWTLATGIASVLRAGGFNAPINPSSGQLAALAPVVGKGKYLTLYTKAQRGGAANAVLAFAGQFFGASGRANDVTGSPAGVGWVSGPPSPSPRRGHWRGYRRGGLVGGIGRGLQRFASGGFVSGVAQTGVGTTANVSFQNAIAQMNNAFNSMSFAALVGLENQFRKMVLSIQANLQGALASGNREAAANFQRELDRLQIGLQAVEFAVGERVKSLTDQVAKLMDRVGRVDQTSLNGVKVALRLTNNGIKIYLRAIRQAIEAGAPKEIIDQLRSGLRDVRDTRKQEIRAQFQIPIDIAGFHSARAAAQLQRLELQQRLAGTFDTTGGEARAQLIRKQIIPDLQAELHKMQVQLNNRISRGTLTADEKRQAQLAIDQKRNDILQAQLDAQQETANNTAKLVRLNGGLGFEFQSQQFSDLISMDTGQ